jgi:capsular exopolysaccharide synthesis family protein
MTIEESQEASAGVGLRHYLDVVRRRKWIVLGVLAVTMAGAAIVSAMQDPLYRAETKIVIGQGQGLFPPTLASAFQPFSATMSDLLSSHVVAREVINNLNLEESEESLLGKMDVSIRPESSALTLSVVDGNAQRARRIAANTGFVFSELVRERFGQPTPVGQGETPIPPLTATVWDPAHIDPARVSPKPVRNLAIAAALGLLLGLLAAFLREHFDRGLRTREAVETAFGVPVIGQIPFERTRRMRQKQRAVSNPFGQSAEAYRALRANLQYLAVQRPLQTILITSASPEQGKTTVTANLAVAIARSGASTIAIEGDLRRPRLAETFGVDGRGGGLTGLLVGNRNIDSAMVGIPVAAVGNDRAKSQAAARLAVLTSGHLPPNPGELLSSSQMEQLLERLKGSYEYVLIDSPPLLLVADALGLARMVDGVVLVARRDEATRDEARETRALVERLGIHLVGTVLTDVAATSAYYGEYRTVRPDTPTRETQQRPLERTP